MFEFITLTAFQFQFLFKIYMLENPKNPKIIYYIIKFNLKINDPCFKSFIYY